MQITFLNWDLLVMTIRKMLCSVYIKNTSDFAIFKLHTVSMI